MRLAKRNYSRSRRCNGYYHQLKLDGTAKGGVVFAIADKFNIPIRYIGVGEQIDDLCAF